MRSEVVFFLNGRRVAVAGDDVWLPVSTWLRERRRLTGTKVVCAEGDCGACTVLVGVAEAGGNGFAYAPLDSCIAFVHQLDGRHLVTVEGLAGTASATAELTGVQRAMVDGHGSQCGFCTPGIVATVHGMLEAGRGDGGGCGGGCGLDAAGIREGLSGNLCRCTGYVQIVEAVQAVDVAAEPGLNARHPPAPMREALAPLVDDDVEVRFGRSGDGGGVLAAPRTLDAALAFRASHPGCTVAAGTTDLGVLHRHGRFNPLSQPVLSLARVDGFNAVAEDAEGFTFGAGATWAQVAAATAERLPEARDMLQRFGSPQVRAAGTLGGNIATGSPIGDSLPLLAALDAALELRSSAGSRTVALADFYTGYKQTVLRGDELIASVRLLLPAADERLRVYKISKRRDMDISTFAATVCVALDDPEDAAPMIRRARIAFGGVAATVVRLPETESFLEGRELCEATMREAGARARAEVKPIGDVRGDAAFRLQLAENILVKFGFEVMQPRGEAVPA